MRQAGVLSAFSSLRSGVQLRCAHRLESLCSGAFPAQLPLHCFIALTIWNNPRSTRKGKRQKAAALQKPMPIRSRLKIRKRFGVRQRAGALGPALKHMQHPTQGVAGRRVEAWAKT